MNIPSVMVCSITTSFATLSRSHFCAREFRGRRLTFGVHRWQVSRLSLLVDGISALSFLEEKRIHIFHSSRPVSSKCGEEKSLG